MGMIRTAQLLIANFGLVLLVGACGPEREPLATASGMSGSPTGNPTGSPTGNPTDGNPTDGSSTETGGAGGCEQYLACVGIVTPDTLPEAEAAFGPGGSCWQGDAALMQQCVNTCEAGLEALGALFSDEPACGGGGTTGTTDAPTTGNVGTGTTGTTGTTSTTDPPQTSTTDPCNDPPNQPLNSECTVPSGCGCSSGMCFRLPTLGGFCSECFDDSQCPDGGCTVPNPIAGVGATCNSGGPGDGCQSDDPCNDANNGVCAVIFSSPGILTVATCGPCKTNADCGPQAPHCAPTYDVPNFSGKYNCVADGAVPNNQGCSLSPGGEAACASGHCGEATILGLFKLGACGQCSVDADCGPGKSCVEPTVDLNQGVLIGAMCI